MTHPAKLLYIGQSYRSKRMQQCWYLLDSPGMEERKNDGEKLNWVEGRSMLFKKVRPFGCKPGAIFTFDMAEDNKSVFPGSAREPERWQNVEDVTLWEINHKTAEHTARTVSLAKKIALDSGLHEMVRPLREMYGRLSFAEQSTFLVMIISEIRRGI